MQLRSIISLPLYIHGKTKYPMLRYKSHRFVTAVCLYPKVCSFIKRKFNLIFLEKQFFLMSGFTVGIFYNKKKLLLYFSSLFIARNFFLQKESASKRS